MQSAETLLGRFEVVRELGPTARVVRDREATDAPLRALRVLDPSDPLRGEVERIVGFEPHPGVAAVHAVGTLEDGQAYFLMDLVEGEDLYTWAIGRAPDEVLPLAAQLLEAFGAYHARGLVPGGRRPYQIRVIAEPTGPRLVLLDHGGLAPEGTRGDPGAARGRGLAPERRAGCRVDRRANLYEVGLVLYELLSSSDVFEAGTLDPEAAGPAPSVTRLAPGLPLDLATFVMVLLRPLPDERPPSVTHALDALEELCGQRLVERSGRPPLLPLPTALVGRAEALERLVAWAEPLTGARPRAGRRSLPLAAAATRAEAQPTLVRVQGPPGAGKRRLLDELALRLALEDVVVLRGQCGGVGQGPFGPFAGAVRELLARRPLRRLVLEGPAESRWVLRALLPDLAPVLAGGPEPPPLEDGEAGAQRLRRGLAEQLLAVARERPIALLLTRIEAARASTRALIGALARAAWVAARAPADANEPRSAPRLLVVLSEAGEVEDEALDGPFARIVALEPLGPERLGFLLSGALGREGCPAEAQRALAAGPGTPGHALTLARALARGEAPEAARPLEAVSALRVALAAADPETRAALLALAALGQPAPLTFLADVALGEEGTLRAGLERAAAEGIVELLTRERYVLDRPELARAAAEVAPTELVEVGARLAARLAVGLASGAASPYEERLAVADLAARFGPVGLLLELAPGLIEPLTALGAPGRAAALCEALARAGHEPSVARRRAADGWLAAGRHARAEVALRALLDDEALPVSARAPLHRALATALLGQGREAEARESLTGACEALEAAGDPPEQADPAAGPVEARRERAQCLALLAALHLGADERAEATARAEQGLALLEGDGDPEAFRLRGRLLGVLGELAVLEERFAAATQTFKAALALQQRLGRDEDAARTLRWLGKAAFSAGQPEQAESSWRESLAHYERLGHGQGAALVRGNLGLAAARRGALGEARDLLLASLREREALGGRSAIATSLHNLGYVYASAGALAEAADCFRRCLALRLEDDDRWYAASAAANLGEVLLELGEVDEAEVRLEEALRARVELADRRGEASCLATLTELHRRQGAFSEALALAARAREIREELRDPEDLVDGLRREARLQLSLGDLMRATRLAERAVALTDQHKLVVLEPATRLLLGEVQARRGRHVAARRELERARRAAERVGDRLTARACVIELAALRLAAGEPADARALLDSRPVPRPGQLQPLEGVAPPDRQGLLRVRERLLRARLELAQGGGSVSTAARSAEAALREARRAGLRDLEWRALQALAACAEVSGRHEDALALTLEAQELVETLLAGVERTRRQAYLEADPLRGAALRGDSPLAALGVRATPAEDSGERAVSTPPRAGARPSEEPPSQGPLLQAMLRSTAPTIEPAPRPSARQQPAGRASEALLASTPTPSGMAREEFAVIVTLNRLLVDEPDLSRVLEAIVGTAAETCRAERAFLALFEGGCDEVTVLATRGFDEVERGSQRFFRRCAFKAATTGQLVLSAEAAVGPETKRQAHVVGLGLRSVVAGPVTVPDGRRGALYVDAPFQVGRFTDREVDLIEALADQCAMALGRGALEQALRDARGVRPGVAQREYLQAKAERERSLLVQFGKRPEGAGAAPWLAGRSPAMRRAVETLERVAPTDLSVLIVGPPGVGKGVAARALHAASGRTGKVVTLDLRELPEEAGPVEALLYGCVAGAFSGADERLGLLREADGGTLLLEHVVDASPAIQAKLVRALEERAVTPLGANAPVPFQARLVATAGPDLEEAVRDGRLRHDLYLLLGQASVSLTPLDERPDDKGPLIDCLLASWRRGDVVPEVTPKARAALELRSYPGNARELNAILAAGAVVADGRPIEVDDLPLARRVVRAPLQDALREFERRYVEAALRANRGDQTRAAQELGISRRALKRKLEQLGITA